MPIQRVLIGIVQIDVAPHSRLPSARRLLIVLLLRVTVPAIGIVLIRILVLVRIARLAAILLRIRIACGSRLLRLPNLGALLVGGIRLDFRRTIDVGIVSGRVLVGHCTIFRLGILSVLRRVRTFGRRRNRSGTGRPLTFIGIVRLILLRFVHRYPLIYRCSKRQARNCAPNLLASSTIRLRIASLSSEVSVLSGARNVTA